MNDFLRAMVTTATRCGMSVRGNIDVELAAKILWITYAYVGYDEKFTTSAKYLMDIYQIQEAYHFQGGEIPDAELCKRIYEMKRTYKTNRNYEWAKTLVKERYGFELKNI